MLTDCRIKNEGGGSLNFFCADEIDNMVSGNDQTIHGIFADNDSVNEDEFEGFGPNVMIFILICIMKTLGQTYLTLKNRV